MLRHLYFCVGILLFCLAVAQLPLSAQAPDSTQPVSAPSAKTEALAPGTPSPPRISPLAKAWELYRTGKLEAAEESYRAILQDDPRSAPAYAGLARIYLKQRRIADASSAAAKAVELAPRMSVGHVAMGEVYYRQGRIAEAEKEFLAEANRGTREARAYLGLARLYAAMSFFERAKKMTDRAYQLDPKDPDIRNRWLDTVSIKERIQAVQAYLKDETSTDSEERRSLEQMLRVLQDEANTAVRSCRLRTRIKTASMDLQPLWFSPKHIRGDGLGVKLNGTPALLLLDTGASGILVDRKFAEKAGVKRIGETEISGIGDKGGASGYVGFADSVRIGDLEFQNCFVEVTDKKAMTGEDGLIGANVFF